MIEAKKLAFADRDRHLADRDFMKVPVTDLISRNHADLQRQKIRTDHAAGEMINAPSGTDTEYVAAADSEGNLVSFIQSNFMGFGSGVVEPETAIILQNRGHLFSLDDNHPNCIGPHKRCVHTLMPGMILRRGKPYAALGLKGGHVQPQVQAQIICNLIDFGMTVQEAISAARFNHIDAAKWPWSRNSLKWSGMNCRAEATGSPLELRRASAALTRLSSIHNPELSWEARTRAKAAARWDIDDPRSGPSSRPKRLGRARLLRRLSYMLSRLFLAFMTIRRCFPKREYTERAQAALGGLEVSQNSTAGAMFGYDLGLWSDED